MQADVRSGSALSLWNEAAAASRELFALLDEVVSGAALKEAWPCLPVLRCCDSSSVAGGRAVRCGSDLWPSRQRMLGLRHHELGSMHDAVVSIGATFRAGCDWRRRGYRRRTTSSRRRC